jgi:hypothetical protein
MTCAWLIARFVVCSTRWQAGKLARQVLTSIFCIVFSDVVVLRGVCREVIRIPRMANRNVRNGWAQQLLMHVAARLPTRDAGHQP